MVRVATIKMYTPLENLGVGLGLGLWLEEVLVFDSKSENRDRAVEAIEAVPEARVRVRVDLV